MKRKLITVALSILLLCSPALTSQAFAHWEFHDVEGKFLFGYTGVENQIPLYRNEVTQNGIGTNVTTLSSDAISDLSGPISYFNSQGDKVGIFLDKILFIVDPNLPTCQGPTGLNFVAWRLRNDYKAKFDSWYARNQNYLTPERVAFLIIFAEANNGCLSSSVLDLATSYVKSKLSTIPTIVGYSLTEGGANATAPLPVQPAGFSFWTYAVRYPNSPTSLFQFWLGFFKTNMQPQQRLVIVFDAHHQPLHTSKGITQAMLGPMAKRYAEVVRSEPKIVGMIGFTWASFDDHIGMRNLPQAVRDDNRAASCMLLCQSLPTP